MLKSEIRAEGELYVTLLEPRSTSGLILYTSISKAKLYTSSSIRGVIVKKHTGLPTKDETSETTVQNCSCPNIHDSLICFFLFQIIK